MEKFKIGVNEQRVSETLNIVEQYNSLWLKIKMEYDKLGLRPLKTGDIANILTGSDFLKDIILEGSGAVSFGGLKLSKNKQRDLVEFSFNPEYFLDAINELITFSKEQSVRSASVSITDFSIVGSKITFQNAQNVIEERNTWYTEDPAKIEYVKALQKICKIMNDCKNNSKFPNMFSNRHVIDLDGEFAIYPQNLIRG